MEKHCSPLPTQPPPPSPASILYGTEKYCIPLLNQPLHPRQYFVWHGEAL